MKIVIRLKQIRLSLFILLTALILASCSSGGGESTDTEEQSNTKMIVDAGQDQAVHVGSGVTLNGSCSNGEGLAYAWTFVVKPEGSKVFLSNPAVASPSFTTDRVGAYQLLLTVTRGTDSVSETVTVHATNTAPFGDAGPDQTVPAGTVVNLAGSASDADGDGLTYAWAIASKPAGSSAMLTDASVADPSFTADKAGTYELALTVTDGWDSVTDTVIIYSAGHTLFAHAGCDMYRKSGTTIALDGSGSNDSDNKAFTYAWSFVAWVGAKPEFHDSSAVRPRFTTTETGTFKIKLVVDNGIETSSDSVVVTVTADTVLVPDTGQTLSSTAVFGEDSDYTLHPQSYTKLGANGIELATDATGWIMVRDNVTGLVWEVKTADDTLQDRDRRYSQATVPAFIDRLNMDFFGGYADWRMPSVKELSSIVNAGTFTPAIDIDYFPKTQPSVYGASTIYAKNTDFEWRVNFNNGLVDVNNDPEVNSYYVRAVRDGQ